MIFRWSRSSFSEVYQVFFLRFGRPQREDLDLAASAGNNYNNNQRFRWQEPPGKIIFVLFCFDTCRDEEKETQNINVVGTTKLGASPLKPCRQATRQVCKKHGKQTLQEHRLFVVCGRYVRGGLLSSCLVLLTT